MSAVPFTSQVLAVIVLYQKPISESHSFQSLQSLLKTGLSVLVFDNSPSAQKVKNEVYYHHAPENPGVSGAYNFAAQKAAELEKKWLWLLDDDTLIDPEFLTDVSQKAGDHEKVELFVPQVYSKGQLLSPFGIERNTTYRLKTVTPGIQNLQSLRPINSGMLLSLKLFKKAGGYNPDLPLDFSDIEFTDRLARIHPEFYVSDHRFKQAFSGDEKPPLNTAKKRFERYLESARVYAETATHPKRVRQQALKRALSLTLQYFSPYFIQAFYQKRFRL